MLTQNLATMSGADSAKLSQSKALFTRSQPGALTTMTAIDREEDDRRDRGDEQRAAARAQRPAAGSAPAAAQRRSGRAGRSRPAAATR